MSRDELDEVLAELANDVMAIMATSRNLGSHYQRLLDILARRLGRGARVEAMGMRDRVMLTVRDSEGNVKQEYDSGWSGNGITNAGMAEVAGLIASGITGVTAFGYIAIGTGTTAFDPSQTALVTEIKRKSATTSRVTTTVTNDTAQWVATFSSADGLTGTSAVTESGIFNASTGGTMLARQVFSTLNINWDAGDSLQVTWKVQVKQAT